jgi:type VI protein secretion system component VasF
VDDILRKPQTIPLIYEVYYFCLSKGFQGRYADNPVKINEYMKKLREKIPVADLESFDMVSEDTGRIKAVGSAIRYYAVPVVVLVVCYFLLRVSADYWDLGFEVLSK